VQEREFKLKHTQYWRARYQRPAGEAVSGELPVAVAGSHFGPTRRSDRLSQHDQPQVPQRLMLKQLWEGGVELSSGQLKRLRSDGHARFHEEKLVIRARRVIARTSVTRGWRGFRVPLAKAGAIFWSGGARVKRTMESTRSRASRGSRRNCPMPSGHFFHRIESVPLRPCGRCSCQRWALPRSGTSKSRPQGRWSAVSFSTGCRRSG
jgi:hypothetical protein